MDFDWHTGGSTQRKALGFARGSFWFLKRIVIQTPRIWKKCYKISLGRGWSGGQLWSSPFCHHQETLHIDYHLLLNRKLLRGRNECIKCASYSNKLFIVAFILISSCLPHPNMHFPLYCTKKQNNIITHNCVFYSNYLLSNLDFGLA